MFIFMELCVRCPSLQQDIQVVAPQRFSFFVFSAFQGLFTKATGEVKAFYVHCNQIAQKMVKFNFSTNHW